MARPRQSESARRAPARPGSVAGGASAPAWRCCVLRAAWTGSPDSPLHCQALDVCCKAEGATRFEAWGCCASHRHRRRRRRRLPRADVSRTKAGASLPAWCEGVQAALRLCTATLEELVAQVWLAVRCRGSMATMRAPCCIWRGAAHLSQPARSEDEAAAATGC